MSKETYHPPKDFLPGIGKASFLFLGIAALQGWNVILNTLDFFSAIYPSYNIPFYFPIPIYAAMISWSSLIYVIAKFITIKQRLLWSQILIAAILMAFPFLTFYENDEGVGFWLSIILLFLMATAGTVLQCSSVALSSVFPVASISFYFTGTGISAIICCIVRMIMLYFLGDSLNEKNLANFVYFILASLLLILSAVLYTFFERSEFFLHNMQKIFKSRENLRKRIFSNDFAENNPGEIPMVNYDESDLTDKEGEYEKRMTGVCQNVVLYGKSHNYEGKSGGNLFQELKFIFYILKKLLPLPIFIWITYAQTFIMFPGVALKKNVSFLDKAWNNALLVFTFNLFDTIGKYLSYFRSFYNILSTSFCIAFRFFLFYTFILMALYEGLPVISTDWFAFVNIGLFGFLHGYITSCSIVMMPGLVRKSERETAGLLVNFPLFFGIFCGTLFALPLRNL